METSALLKLCLILSIVALGTAGKHFAVLGGSMKSHHITVVPFIEGLLERGHRVSFLVPNTTEHRSYFPKGIGNASMVFLGADWSIDTLFSGPEYDVKNLPWYKKPLMYAKVLSQYRQALDKPLFSMHDELVAWIKIADVDAFLVHGASLGSMPLVAESGTPWVAYLSLPPIPFILVHERDRVCRYPNFLDPPSAAKLKESLMARVRNHMTCRLLQGYMFIINHEVLALYEERGLGSHMDRGLLAMMTTAPQLLLLGGAPLSINMELGPNIHVLGTVNRPKVGGAIPADMLSWLQAAHDAGAPVIYISMGTKYELHKETCAKLVAILHRMMDSPGVRILWSLRTAQQEELRLVLPAQGQGLRIETFTPQWEVLQHAAVKVFLSHCGWGGVTDTISAGVPVLAYPGGSDQFTNARMLEQAGAGVILSNDFSNLFEGTQLLLEDPSFASASRVAGEALDSYGGLSHGIEILEAAADGNFLESENHANTHKLDPFFDEPQVLEQWISLMICLIVLSLGPLMCCCCCRVCFCRKAKKSTAAMDGTKKRQ